MMIVGTTALLGFKADQLQVQLTNTAAAERIAVAANVQAQEKLWISYRNEAHARHRSRQSGQRFGALRAVVNALQIPIPKKHSLDELRTEATAALCLPDLEVDQKIPHTSRVGQFVLDNRLTVLGFDDVQSRQFVVHELATGTERMRMDYVDSHFDYHAQAFSPDSRFLVYPKLIDGTQRLHVWSVADGKPVIDLGAEAINFEFRQDSQRVAVASTTGQVRILDCNGFAELQAIQTGMNSPEVAWNPRFPQLVVADHNHWKVVDLNSGATLSERHVNEGLSGWPSWHPSGRKFAMGTGNLMISMWDSVTSELTCDPIRGHRNGGIIVRISPDGDRLVSNDWDQTVRMWDTRSGQPLLSVLASGNKLQFDETGTHLAADCASSEVRFFTYRSGNEFRTIRSHSGMASDFIARHSVPCLNKTGRLMAVRVPEGVCLIDLTRDEVVGRLPVSGNGPFRFTGSGDTESLWTYGQSGLISWPLKIDDAGGTASIGPPERLLDLRQEHHWGSSADGSMILVPGVDQAILWNQETRKQERLLPGHWDVRTCAVTPDGKIGITGSHSDADTGAVVWDLVKRRSIADLSVPPGNVFLSPDGQWLITNGGVTRIWRVGEWTESRVISQFRSQVCFSSDSQLVALSDDRSLVRLLIPETGRQVAVLTAPETTQLLPLLFTRDGKRLITFGTETGALHIFDLQAIRKQLVEKDLDWDYPPFPPEVEVTPSADALKFTVDMGMHENLIQSRQVTDAARQLSREGKTQEYINLLKRAVELDPRNARAHNNLAWTLAVGPQELRDTSTALVSAAAAVAEEPSQQTYRNTLGIVQFQAGQCDNAVLTLNESVSMRGFYDSHDAFFLAMAHWKRGEKDVAREWLQKAVDWMNKNASSDPELMQFRQEAEQLISPSATLPTGEP
jgi:WD40 repeat protein